MHGEFPHTSHWRYPPLKRSTLNLNNNLNKINLFFLFIFRKLKKKASKKLLTCKKYSYISQICNVGALWMLCKIQIFVIILSATSKINVQNGCEVWKLLFIDVHFKHMTHFRRVVLAVKNVTGQMWADKNMPWVPGLSKIYSDAENSHHCFITENGGFEVISPPDICHENRMKFN